MSTEQNKTIVRRFLEASVQSDPSALKELLPSDFLAHIPSGPTGREGFIQHNSVFTNAFSDKQFVVEDLIAEGDKVVALATWKGVHSAAFMGVPPTGKQISVSATLIERFKDGKLVEHKSLFDTMGMMQQLGLVPASRPG